MGREQLFRVIAGLMLLLIYAFLILDSSWSAMRLRDPEERIESLEQAISAKAERVND